MLSHIISVHGYIVLEHMMPVSEWELVRSWSAQTDAQARPTRTPFVPSKLKKCGRQGLKTHSDG